jgi:glycosyltransferase involved in cell wall biosynthesis
MASTLSVIVPARNAARHVERCLRSVLDQRPAVREIILVDDCSRDQTAALAKALGVSVVALPARTGAGGARNAGARVASGDVLAFLDSDDEAEPGWAAAVAARVDSGADIVAGALHAREPRTLTEWFIQSQEPGHDLTGRRTRFLPFAVSTNMAIRREVFDDLGGFDTSFFPCEDADLSYRAQFVGYRITPAPEAGVIRHHRDTPLALMRQRARNARSRVYLRWKYQRYPFQSAYAVVGHRRIWAGLLADLARGAIRPGEDRRELAKAWFAIAVYFAACTGEWCGKLELWSGVRRPPDVLYPRSNEEAVTAAPLASSPEVLVLGDDFAAVRYLVNALGAAPDLAVAPPVDAGEAVARWDEPAPWSLRLVREARAAGWRIPQLLAARRVEGNRPATWGQAFLSLHAVNAWLRGKTAYGLAATGAAGSELARHLPGVPVVVVGRNQGRLTSPALVVSRRDLLSRPRETLARLETVVGRPLGDRAQALPPGGRLLLFYLLRVVHEARLSLGRGVAG